MVEYNLMYLRKSREDERDPDFTLDKHRRTLLEYAKREGLGISKIYEEVVSGDTIAARPQMQALLKEIESGTVTGIICMDLDRLGRGDMKDQGVMFEIIKFNRVIIYTPDRQIDLNNPCDQDYAEFKAFFARMEYNTIKRRLRNGTNRTAKDGWHVSCIPFGYERIYMYHGKPSHNKNGKPTLKEDELTAPYVRMMFDMYVNQLKGTPTIAQTLNAMGIKTSRGNDFRRNSVTKILKNPIYIGKIYFNREECIRKSKTGSKSLTRLKPESEWIIVDGNHPAIIDEETFYKAQEMLKGRTHPPFNTGELKNPLAGLIICSKCGNPLQRRPYYQRGNSPHILCVTKDCQMAVLQSKLEKAILEDMSEYIKNADKKFRAIITTVKEDNSKEQIKSLERELNKLCHQKTKLYDFLEQEIYTIDVFTERHKEISEKIALLSNHILEIKNKAATTEEQEEKLKQRLSKMENLLSEYETLTPQQKNVSLKQIYSKIYYTREKGPLSTPFTLECEYL